jgi:PAS domain S-box-containing protein
MYRSVIENIQDVYYRSDREGRLLMTSLSGATMFGFERVEDMIGIDVQSFWVDPGERPRLISEVVKHGSVKDYVGPMRRKDGSVFWPPWRSIFTGTKSETRLGRRASSGTSPN